MEIIRAFHATQIFSLGRKILNIEKPFPSIDSFHSICSTSNARFATLTIFNFYTKKLRVRRGNSSQLIISPKPISSPAPCTRFAIFVLFILGSRSPPKITFGSSRKDFRVTVFVVEPLRILRKLTLKATFASWLNFSR